MDGLYGGAGNDRLDGGTENDQVDGQGDDDLWGDAEYAAFSQLWGRTVTNGVINYVLEQDFCGISLAVSGDDRLFGGGGISANGIWGTDLAIQRVGQK
jgi:Ca2+-binding RTX toxin-like protein